MIQLSNPEAMIQTPSFGGDVADFFGTLKQLQTGEPYHGSMNPNGNPFSNMSLEEMTAKIISRYPSSSSLEIVSQRMDDFFGVKPDEQQELPEVYNKTHQVLLDTIEAKKAAQQPKKVV